MAINSEDKKITEGLLTFCSERPVIFDVGSNKGSWADIILERFGDNCDLHLFEPNQKLLSFTEIKYEYRPNIKYISSGVHSYSGSIDFFYFENKNNELSSLVKSDEWAGLPMKQQQIKVVSIDEYCGQNGIDYIDILKIDVEGTDPHVIEGAARKMGEGKIGAIIIEYSPHYKRAGNTFLEVIKRASKHGYKVYRYASDNYWPIEEQNFSEDYRFENYVITKWEVRNHSVGWNKDFILNMARLPKPSFVLEIGAFEGLTSKYICQHLLDGPEARMIAVDPLTDEYIPGDEQFPYFKNQYQRFLRNTRGLPVELKRGESAKELPKLNAFRFDIVYVDGDHREPAVYFDSVWAFALTKYGGHIVWDDYDGWSEETKRGIDKFLNEFSGAYEVVEQEYQVVIRKTQNRYNELTFEYYK